MREPPEQQKKRPGWGVPASVAAHVLVIALLIFGLPLPQFEPQQPETIAVELVPPPELEQPPQEEAKQEEEKPEEAEQQEAAQEEPPPPPPEQTPEEQQASAPPIQVLRPVFEFGEQDTGPREAPDGNSSVDAETEETALDPAPEPLDQSSAPVPAEKPPVELAEARTLFSRALSNDPAAMTAMGSLPREIRGRELCTTELREQLRHATPPYRPDLLPAYPLGDGSVLEERQAAFRAGGQWFDLSFRCEVDEAATRVLSFAFTVGQPIPRGEWRARGFPVN